jgi:hypothetical protein
LFKKEYQELTNEIAQMKKLLHSRIANEETASRVEKNLPLLFI